MILTDEMFNYYQSIRFSDIKEDIPYLELNRLQELNKLAINDIKRKKLVRDKSEFNSSSEYRHYLSCLRENAIRIHYGFEPMALVNED